MDFISGWATPYGDSGSSANSPSPSVSNSTSSSSIQTSSRPLTFSAPISCDDPPGTHYPPHTHPGDTRVTVLSGSVTVTYPLPSHPSAQLDPSLRIVFEKGVQIKEESVTYGPGDTYAVPAGVVHAITVGTEGCRRIGEHLCHWEPQEGLM